MSLIRELLQELIERFNTWPQARFYLEHNHVDAEDYLAEHDLYMRRIHEAESMLRASTPRNSNPSLPQSFFNLWVKIETIQTC